jgi:pimeloyl-ACP methyl ester carboxylesterase
MAIDEAPLMAVRRRGSGPDLVLFHGGMGCWQHWVRNIGPLSEHFTVHALDHPSYGASASVPRQTTGAAYLELVYDAIVNMFPGEAPLRFAGFSFGGAMAAHLAARLGQRVTHLCLISPGGFPPRQYAGRPTRSYKAAGDNEALFREICRHNLLVNMLSDAASISEDTLDIQAYCVRHTRFNSRKVSGGGTLLGDLAKITCRLRLLWGERDDAPFRPAADFIAQIRAVVDPLDLHRVPQAGHWAAYENAPAVNRLMLEFFTT